MSRKAHRFMLVSLAVGALLPMPEGAPAAHQRATENVILFTFDGLRWQDLFRGADRDLMNEEAGGVRDVETLRDAFWRDSVEARRRTLLPFFWEVVAARGQVFGNVDRGSEVKVTNGMIFSYPGYNEMLSGFPDERIDSNAKRPNPNVTVLEWLNRRAPFAGRVAAFTSWDVFPYIINEPRSGIPVNSGWEAIDDDGGLSGREVLLNELMRSSFHPSEEVRDDAITLHAALEYLRRHGPRVLYIGLDRTDTSAHNGRYDRYLRAAHKTDQMLRELWESIESIPQYAGRTTLVITTDHGRGVAPRTWRDHGDDVPGADNVWIAVMGPDTLPLGVRSATETLTQAQVAATLAGFLGEDYAAATAAAAAPIPGIGAGR